MLYTNPRSIQNKVLELQDMITNFNIKLLFLVETWLNEDFKNEFLGLPDFMVYRRDRATKGGGLLIAIHKSINSKQIEIKCEEELLIVDIWLHNTPHQRIILAYNPSKADVSYLRSLTAAISTVINNKINFTILGDINIPYNELNDSDFLNREPHKTIKKFLNLNQPLYQNIRSPTRSNNILDYILTNNLSTLSEISVHPPIGRSDHSVIYANYNFKNQIKSLSSKFTFKNFGKANTNAINDFLQERLLNLQSSNTSNLWIQFDFSVKEAIEKFVPMTTLHQYRNRIINNTNFKLYKRFHRLYLKFIATNNRAAFDRYKFLKQTYSYNLKTSRENFENKLLSQISHRKCFKYIRNNLKPHEDINYIQNIHSEDIKDRKTIANEFNNYFVQNFNHFTNLSDFLNLDTTKDQIIISESTIKQAIKHLRNASGVGIDEIPIRFWVNLSDWFPKILAKLFTVSANTGNIPQNWKTCKIVPLYKNKGNKHNVDNYRPISVLNSLARIFETSLYLTIRDTLESKISNKQHGFVRAKNTLTNLLNSYNKVYSCIDQKLPTHTVIIDYQKAFDKVPHDLLLEKLSNIGLSNSFIKLFASWLSDRVQIVKINNEFSQPARLQRSTAGLYN